MTTDLTPTQKLVYAAALFEARGIFTIYDRPVTGKGGPKVYKQVRLRIRTDAEAPVLLLHELFGGTYSQPAAHAARQWWEYRLSGDEAKAAMRKLRPYLLARRAQVEELLAA